MGLEENKGTKRAFSDKEITHTSDIEVLRKAYFDLYNAYQEEIRQKVMLEIEKENRTT